MIKLYHAYKCEFTGRASESADEVRGWEIDAATKIVAGLKNVGELRAALKRDDDKLWRAIRYLDQNKHHIAVRPPEPKAPAATVDSRLSVAEFDAAMGRFGNPLEAADA